MLVGLEKVLFFSQPLRELGLGGFGGFSITLLLCWCSLLDVPGSGEVLPCPEEQEDDVMMWVMSPRLGR